MGTNYYLVSDPCKTCGHSAKRRHIGKSSGGWCFSLHVYPEDDINDLDDWMPLLKQPGHRIVEEYGGEVSFEDLLQIITGRSWKRHDPDGWEMFLKENHGEPGPNGLARHRLGDGLCVKHGSGTWDCLVGYFS